MPDKKRMSSASIRLCLGRTIERGRKMDNFVEIVATINFGGHTLDVYSSLDEPLFKAVDVAKIIDYSAGNTWRMLDLCENDEKLELQNVVAGQRRRASFVTEMGLYNILSQSSKPIARKWRRVVHQELIDLRKERNMNFVEQMGEWEHAMDDIFFDDEGKMWRSITVAGGDVEQVPYRE
jgi:prophage antirepressor-like protein